MSLCSTWAQKNDNIEWHNDSYHLNLNQTNYLKKSTIYRSENSLPIGQLDV